MGEKVVGEDEPILFVGSFPLTPRKDGRKEKFHISNDNGGVNVLLL